MKTNRQSRFMYLRCTPQTQYSIDSKVTALRHEERNHRRTRKLESRERARRALSGRSGELRARKCEEEADEEEELEFAADGEVGRCCQSSRSDVGRFYFLLELEAESFVLSIPRSYAGGWRSTRRIVCFMVAALLGPASLRSALLPRSPLLCCCRCRDCRRSPPARENEGGLRTRRGS